jgi:hypothetical protein
MRGHRRVSVYNAGQARWEEPDLNDQVSHADSWWGAVIALAADATEVR